MKKKDICANLPVLETERLVLRKVRAEDAKDIFTYASNDAVSQFVTWNSHQSLSDTQTFIDFILQEYEDENLACWGIVLKENNRLIGTIDFVDWDTKNKVGEIGYVLSEEYWAQGIMTEAAIEVVNFGFKRMNLVRIQARCFVDNIGSETVMRKIGMRYEGTVRKALLAKGKHHNLKMYSILQEEIDTI
ncbi:GNAT family N-acetyltransferase [Radiobacillus sp. PE A8.2]|uniref:GNAT family N-acetyltransferase n=1 Tax=Radiobacillus sp. PE A8.2 TaxID=3380349 RepID=UPI00388EB7FD